MERHWRLMAVGVSCAAALWASAVQAEQIPVSGYTGSKLRDACEGQDSSQRASCLAYIGGVADVVVFAGRGKSPIIACTPPSATNAQLVDVTVQFLHDHPRYAHLLGCRCRSGSDKKSVSLSLGIAAMFDA